MVEVEQTLTRWRASLCPKVEVGALLARNPVAHKWKATFRSLVLRETAFWRIHDLLTQSYELHQAQHILGSRILLRSAFETLATLIYLNHSMRNVLAGHEDFHTFSQKTSRLLLGGKIGPKKHEAINILTILKKCEIKYPDLSDTYAILSESAHPNFEGMCFGYSRIDHENHRANFSNYMAEMHERSQHSLITLCMSVFEEEYNHEWRLQFEKLETWITENDAMLESTKNEAV